MQMKSILHVIQLRANYLLDRNSRKWLILITTICLFAFVLHSKTNCSPDNPFCMILEETRSAPELDLPSLLHLPTLTLGRDTDTFKKTESIARIAARKKPDSLLATYRAISSKCAVQPFAPHLQQAARVHRARYSPNKMAYAAEHDRTLTIHLHRSRPITWPFQHAINNTSPKFDRVLVLLTGKGRNVLEQFVYGLRDHAKEIHVVKTKSEEDAVLFSSHAAHLMVHSGELSALMAMTSEQKVYFPSDLYPHAMDTMFKFSLKNQEMLPRDDHSLPLEQVNALRAFAPKPSCCHFDGYDNPPYDDKKLVCTNLKNFAKPPCWIMSVGSRGHFVFEEIAFNRTKCVIQTFDCTGDFVVPDNIKSRVIFHKKCIGGINDPRPDYGSFGALVRIGAKASGLAPDIPPTFAKIDAEGYEYPSMIDLVRHERKYMPPQIGVEVHMLLHHPVGPPMFNVTNPDGTVGSAMNVSTALEFIGVMSTGGYELVGKVDNLWCPTVCSETSFVRKDLLPLGAVA